MPHLDELHALLGALTHVSDQPDAAGFIERNRVIDELEVHLAELTHTEYPDGIVGRQAEDLRVQVAALRDRLQHVNDAMARDLRQRIANAGISRRELLTMLERYVGESHDTRDDVKYDALDALVAAILSTEQVEDDGGVGWDPEMVPYQPTPARLVLELIRQVCPTERDVFVDVGSGLGTVPMLVSLLTGARAIGIEWHPDYWAHAERCARDLNLSSVSFTRQDARDADYSTGTIFYMYTPFRGAMLRAVLRRLDSEGRRRQIRLCIHGPLLREAIDDYPAFSLERASSRDDFITVFQSSPDWLGVPGGIAGYP